MADIHHAPEIHDRKAVARYRELLSSHSPSEAARISLEETMGQFEVSKDEVSELISKFPKILDLIIRTASR